MSLARRSLTSITWKLLTSPLNILVLFVRSIILARMIPVESFGVYTLAASIVGITSLLASFGMGDAFLHRSEFTQDESQAAAYHFTLRLFFTLVWATLIISASFAFATGADRTALIILAFTTAGNGITQTASLILTRRVVHRRLVLLQLSNTLLSTLTALGLASLGFTLWALLATDMVTMTINIVGLYAWRPVWRPRLAFDRKAARYFLGFGSQGFIATILQKALNQVDDLWSGAFLGRTPLGFYSRAYTFATYPRRIVASQVNMVVRGAFTELSDDRLNLSRYFFRVTAFLTRVGFMIAGILALIAPEFIHLALTDKWLPMLVAFRLMLVYAMLDPLKATIASVFVAVGHPGRVVQARFIQLLVLVAGLFILGPRWGIAGVAIAVDIMVVVGMSILFFQVRRFVDFSPIRLFLPPLLALTVGMLLARAAIEMPALKSSYWITASVKLSVFLPVYAIILVAWERRELASLLRWVRSTIKLVK